MKKAVLFCLLLSYGFSTMGATVHLHYCMNKFVGASLQNNKEEACSNCGMKARTKNKCCKDEHKQLKLSSAHHKAGITQYTQTVQVPALIALTAFTNSPHPVLGKILPLSNASSGKHRYRLYSLHCIFLI